MRRRRRRTYGVQSTARAVARAPRPVGIYTSRWLPPGLSARDRRRLRTALNREVRRYKRLLKRDLTIAELGVLRRRAASDYIRFQSAVRSDSAKVKPAPVHVRGEKPLFFGRAKGGTGSTGLTGSLRRRQHRSIGRKLKLHKPEWIDPFPQIPGTEPEKRIFAALVQRRIYFIFHGTPDDFRDDKDVLAVYAPTLHDFDFLLPEYRVVIDPFSEYHHGQADSIVRDTRRRLVLGVMSWAYYTPWAHEVDEQGGEAILAGIEELNHPPIQKLSEKDEQAKRAQGYRLGAALGTGAFSVGIANRKRRRAPSLRLGR